MRHCRLKQLEKSAVAEHALKEAGHEILFQNTEVLDNTSNHFVRPHREAIEIHKHEQSFNKKRRKSRTQQNLAPSTEKYNLQKVNKFYQPQGPVITAQKRLANDIHQSQ